MGSSSSRPSDDVPQHRETKVIQGPLPPIPPQQPHPNKPLAAVNHGISPAGSAPPKYQLTTSRPLQEHQSIIPSLPTVPTPSILGRSALTFGGYSAGAGFFYGVTLGILQGRHPIVTTIASTIQWGVAGTCFSGVRSVALISREDTPATRYSATILASVAAGAVGTALSGRGRFAPKTLAAGLAGAGGQWIWDRREERQRERDRQLELGIEDERQTWLQWAFTRKYSPMRLLTDQEHKDLLEQKLIRIEAEIAVLQDDITAIRRDSERAQENAQSKAQTQALSQDSIGKTQQ